MQLKIDSQPVNNIGCFIILGILFMYEMYIGIIYIVYHMKMFALFSTVIDSYP